MSEVIIRDATDADLPAITEIYNHAVLTSTATWDLAPVTLDERREYLEVRRAAGHAVLVAEVDGQLRGWAGYGRFSPRAGYDATVEHGIYVTEEARGLGIGRSLLTALIDHARTAGLHVLVGRLAADNHVSYRLHTSLGFAEVGRMPQVGRKFGRWLDLVWMALILDDVTAADRA